MLRFEKDCAYLKKAFLRTETLWECNFKTTKDVRLVMLSEAPLFGCKEAYFYNTATPFTSFFSRDDAMAILLKTSEEQIGDAQYEKKIILKALADAGFVILDLFPFALNKLHTGIGYSSPTKAEALNACLKSEYRKLSPKRYQTLFMATASIYFIPKLKRLIGRNSFPRLVFRYKRLQDAVGSCVETELIANGLHPTAVKSISSGNIPMDQKKLKRIWGLCSRDRQYIHEV